MRLKTVAVETLLRRHGVQVSSLVKVIGTGAGFLRHSPLINKVLAYFLLRGGMGLEGAELNRNSKAHIHAHDANAHS